MIMFTAGLLIGGMMGVFIMAIFIGGDDEK